MAVLPILIWPDDRLTQECAPVPAVDDNVRSLAQNMFDTLYKADGRGLAAPQIGDLRRVFIMDAGWKHGASTPMVFVNPLIQHLSGDVCEGPEGCLSIPGVTAQVRRSPRVTVSWTDLDGAAQARDFDGFEAICIQHEFDHLDGIITFLRVDAAQRTALEAEYFA
jgi:peptide deformylase